MSSHSLGHPADGLQLVVVIGNTTTTIAVFRPSAGPDPEIRRMSTALFSQTQSMAAVLESLVAEHGTVAESAICSVVPAVAERCSALLSSQLDVPVVAIDAQLPNLPFTLRYENPHGFGADRIALCAWSQHLFPGEAHIAVDLGTAITFDVLDAHREYVGGLILPGLDLMSGALHSGTAQLPKVGFDGEFSLLGRSTGECIRNGVYWGVVYEVRGLVDAIAGHLRERGSAGMPRLIITGGNSRQVARHIEHVDIVDEHAVIRGSRLLLEMNPPG